MRKIFGSSRGNDIVNDHRMLLEALENRDAEAAANITRNHVSKANIRMRRSEVDRASYEDWIRNNCLNTTCFLGVWR
ncbi:hypothetical protein D3C81_1302920 [compost metagenome]